MKEYRTWTADEVAKLRELAADTSLTYSDIGDRLGRTFNAVDRKMRALRLSRSTVRPWDDDETRAAASLSYQDYHRVYPDRSVEAYYTKRTHYRGQLTVPQVELTDYTSLVRDVHGDAVVCACVHVPETDPEFWAKALAIGERDGIRTLIIAGDIVTGDMFSKWLANGQIPEWKWEHELESLRLHLSQALAVFDQVVITPGNHVSNRIVRVTGGHVRLKHIIEMSGLADELKARVHPTDIDFVRLHSGEALFLVGHASNYSKIDGRVSTWYAEKYECHVITGNGHRTGHGVSRSGKWHGWDIGTMANYRLMGYANQALTNFPQMLNSFLAVRGGAVTEYGPGLPMTDWVSELGHGHRGSRP